MISKWHWSFNSQKYLPRLPEANILSPFALHPAVFKTQDATNDLEITLNNSQKHLVYTKYVPPRPKVYPLCPTMTQFQYITHFVFPHWLTCSKKFKSPPPPKKKKEEDGRYPPQEYTWISANKSGVHFQGRCLLKRFLPYVPMVTKRKNINIKNFKLKIRFGDTVERYHPTKVGVNLLHGLRENWELGLRTEGKRTHRVTNHAVQQHKAEWPFAPGFPKVQHLRKP